jgi:hypothetical protein
MNLSNLEHLIEALLIQVIIGVLSGNWWAGAAAGSFFFIGREHAQAEYRWIDLLGHGKRINMPWWGGFDKRVWTHLDSWLDWSVPALATLSVAGYFQYGR